MGGKIRAGTAALASVLMAGSACAAPKCARPDEITAIQTAAIQQELMVAALTCNEIDHFNAFQTGFNKELRRSDATLEHMFRRLFGSRQGEAQYHAFKTRLANDSSMRSIRDNADYCQQARQVFAAALAPDKPTLANFVATIPVTEASPVDSCELRVAGGLSSLHASLASDVAVPKPNPLRLAMVEPAAALAPAPVEVRVQATAPVQPPKPAEQKKDKSGWLSGIFH
jgi:hypothetical protein